MYIFFISHLYCTPSLLVLFNSSMNKYLVFMLAWLLAQTGIATGLKFWSDRRPFMAKSWYVRPVEELNNDLSGSVSIRYEMKKNKKKQTVDNIRSSNHYLINLPPAQYKRIIYIHTQFILLFLSSELCPIPSDFGRTHHI